MRHLALLGTLDLRGSDGSVIDSVLSQPKPLAVLVYLSLAAPGSFQRRDTLVSLFWPDSDARHARNSLSQSLSVLRKGLGSDVVATRGHEEVGLDAGHFRCDAVDFQESLRAGRLEEAMSLYRGDLATGFHVHAAPAFDQWLEAQRRRLREAAQGAASELAWKAREEGRLQEAVVWARRARSIRPLSGHVMGDLIDTLAASGDRAGAVEAFESYAARLRAEYELEPSVELVERVRATVAVPAEPVEVDPDHSARSRGPPPGIGTTARITPKPSVDASRSLLLLVLLAVTAIGGTLAATTYFGSRGDPSQILSLAVLPLQNLSDDPAHEYFAYGLTESLSTEVGQISALTVISTTSAVRTRDKGLSVREIASELGVDALIQGSVLWSADEVRINLQLLDGLTARQLWGKSYQRDLRDLLALQAEVARDISTVVRAAVSREEAARLSTTRSIQPHAVTHYLRGAYELQKLTVPAFEQALGHFRRAIELDSTYAEAYAGLSVAYIQLGSWSGSLPPRAVRDSARLAASNAVERDPTLAEARIALARVRHVFDWDWEGAEQAFRRGIELDPSSSYAYSLYTDYLISMGRLQEAVEYGTRNLEVAPHDANAYRKLAVALRLLDRDAEAHVLLQQALEAEPNSFLPHIALANLYLKQERFTEALRHAQRAEELPPGLGEAAAWLASHVAIVYAAAGRRQEALRVLNELHARAETKHVPPTHYATIYVALGMKEEALDLFEDAVEAREPTCVWMYTHWHMDAVRDEPRFQELLRRMEFPDTGGGESRNSESR